MNKSSQSAFHSKIVNTDIKEEVFSIYSAVGGIGAIIVPIPGGMLYDKVSITSSFYTNGIVLIIICLLAFLFLGKNKSKRLYPNEIVLLLVMNTPLVIKLK